MAEEKPLEGFLRRRWKTATAITVVTVVVILALVLGLVLGLRNRNASSGSSAQALNTTQLVTTDQTEWVLSSNNFTISSTTTTRYYEFNVSQMQGAPDGYERTMLVVNGQYNILIYP
ncbi:hypothetical protein BZG36_03531 [Bifiguratus adelaidae]|uniref:Uncharacterized protein n=1 Tax=Bifiguratus adelaidae TaxID=1938954 RepID=A0A261XZD3_9FUNG|nr:hypothetical protein BZG36_03531 [Bifiguratus adelaidae]